MTGAAPVGADDVLAGVVVDVGGVAFALGADDPSRAEAVASLFRHAVPSGAAADALVWFETTPAPRPAEPPTTVTPHADFWHAGPERLTVCTDAGLTVQATPSALIVGGGTTGLAREFRFAALIGLTHLLARHDRHLLHGAALEVHGVVLVVLGPTGTGKSTLAYAAHRSGWPLIADDAVLAQRTAHGVTVHGVPRPVAVGADVVDAVVGGRPVPEDGRDRTELPAGTLAPGGRRAAALAVTTGVDPRGPGIDPLGGPDALPRCCGRASRSPTRTSAGICSRSPATWPGSPRGRCATGPTRAGRSTMRRRSSRRWAAGSKPVRRLAR